MKSSKWREGLEEVPLSLPSPLPPSCSQGLSVPGSRAGGIPPRADMNHRGERTLTQHGHWSPVNELRWLGTVWSSSNPGKERIAVTSWKLGEMWEAP